MTEKLEVSVCICTYDRYELLQRLLESLQTIELDCMPGNVQVSFLIVDNMPSSRTQVQCQHFAESFPFPLRYVVEDERGISQARNRSVSEALAGGADFIAFIDDDDLPNPDWLSKLLTQQARTEADIVFGCWQSSEEAPEWAQQSGIFKSLEDDDKRQSSSRDGLPWMASTCNALVGKRILSELSSHGECFQSKLSHSGGEDKDFFIRAIKAGATITSAVDSIVIRHHDQSRYSVLGLLQRGFKNGCSRMIKLNSSRNRVQSLRQILFSCIKFIFILGSLPFVVFSKGVLMHQLYRLGKAAGVIYFSFTGRSYAYYSR